MCPFFGYFLMYAIIFTADFRWLSRGAQVNLKRVDRAKVIYNRPETRTHYHAPMMDFNALDSSHLQKGMCPTQDS